MRTNRQNLITFCQATIAVFLLALPTLLPAQTGAAKSSGVSNGSRTQWSLQVDKVNPGDLDVAGAFQIAIYENLLQEMNKAAQFQQVFRDGDQKASDVPNLLVLKTTVEKYSPGSETKRAVTTVSGATKLTVRSQLCTREGKVVVERTVNGNVRFFGSNLRATHNLAHNIAKEIKKSPWSAEQPPAILTSSSDQLQEIIPVSY